MRFQGLAVTLGKQRWPQLVACQRKKDLGLDAYAPASQTPGIQIPTEMNARMVDLYLAVSQRTLRQTNDEDREEYYQAREAEEVGF